MKASIVHFKLHDQILCDSHGNSRVWEEEDKGFWSDEKEKITCKYCKKHLQSIEQTSDFYRFLT